MNITLIRRTRLVEHFVAGQVKFVSKLPTTHITRVAFYPEMKKLNVIAHGVEMNECFATHITFVAFEEYFFAWPLLF